MSLKDFFFESNESPKDKTPALSKLSPSGQAKPGNVGSSFQFTIPNQPVSSGQDFEKFKIHFDQIFDQANLPGPDYYEFSKMVDSMGTAIPLETRIFAAFSGLKIQGLTKERLISSASEYIRILDADAINFSKKVQEEVTSKKKSVEETAKLVEQKKQAMEQLQKEINEHQITINEYSSIESKMNEKISVYNLALNQMKNRISEDINHITPLQ
jgi:hypothetical protein